jgi:cyclopropane fatty-acyl-phospholipid synthase-like methyltransferase
MSLVARVLGHPWVFDHVRPLVAGGIDMSPAYRQLGCDPSSVVLDIGCGTGDALAHLQHYQSYLGVDTDPVAIRHASERHRERPNARFECRVCTARDFESVPVSHVSMVGLFHHLSDAQVGELLAMLRHSPTLVRAVSLDIVYLPGRWYNNLLARFDRGRFCRSPSEYEALVRSSGLRLAQSRIVPSHPTRGLVDYFVMDIVP